MVSELTVQSQVTEEALRKLKDAYPLTVEEYDALTQTCTWPSHSLRKLRAVTATEGPTGFRVLVVQVVLWMYAELDARVPDEA